MKLCTYKIPSVPTVTSGDFSHYELGADVSNIALQFIDVFDILPGNRVVYGSESPTLLHVVVGSVNSIEAGQYYGINRGGYVLTNTDTVICRVILVGTYGEAAIETVRSITDTEAEDRPIPDMVLCSLAKHVVTSSYVGYEYVQLPSHYTVPRHVHALSSSLVLILSGTGLVGLMDEDGIDIVQEIAAGSVMYIPAGTEHGFHSIENLVLVSIQDPPIDNDYKFEGMRPFRYFVDL